MASYTLRTLAVMTLLALRAAQEDGKPAAPPEPCLPGSFVSSSGACEGCRPGTYSASPDAAECTKCVAGRIHPIRTSERPWT